MGEMLPDGRMAYPYVVLLVPRRAGKTTLTLSTMLQRAAMSSDARVWYTAQTGGDAGDSFRDDWLPILKDSPLQNHLLINRGNGKQRITTRAGGVVALFAPTKKALHGKPVDFSCFDEAWAHDAARGQELESGGGPTGWTRPRRQRLITSAGGTEDSTWLLQHRAVGRQAVEDGTCAERGLAFIEYYPPGDLDERGELRDRSSLDDPDVWVATHPAIGHTIPLDAIKQDRLNAERDTEGEGLSGFYRNLLNVTASRNGDRVLSEAGWSGLLDPELRVLGTGVPVFGYAVEHERDRGAIVAAVRQPSGTVHAVLVDERAGAEWMAPRLRELRERHRDATLVALGGVSPAATVTAALLRDRVPVELLDAGETAAACAELLDVVNRGTGWLRVREEARLSAAAGNLAKRELGDGFAWTQKRSGTGVAPIVALTAAAARARKAPPSRLAFTSSVRRRQPQPA
jgi:hypothetical protein